MCELSHERFDKQEILNDSHPLFYPLSIGYLVHAFIPANGHILVSSLNNATAVALDNNQRVAYLVSRAIRSFIPLFRPDHRSRPGRCRLTAGASPIAVATLCGLAAPDERLRHHCLRAKPIRRATRLPR